VNSPGLKVSMPSETRSLVILSLSLLYTAAEVR
jgi:hypothetical protein